MDVRGFFLWDCLLKGKKVSENFKSRFLLGFKKNDNWYIEHPDSIYEDPYKIFRKNPPMIETDGRLYRFYFNNKPKVTIDIGFNFFDNNFCMSDFRKKFYLIDD